jgi:hypothetical protein
MFTVVGRSAAVELRPMNSTDDSLLDLDLSLGTKSVFPVITDKYKNADMERILNE